MPRPAALFPAFIGTMLVSDFPAACASGLWPQAFPDRPAGGLRGRTTRTAGISRFSCMERSRMRRVIDSAGRLTRLALSPRILLPSLPPYEVGAPGVITELNGWPACSPVNACRVPSGARSHDSGPWWVAAAFHVRLCPSLLHAGSSRRSLVSPDFAVGMRGHMGRGRAASRRDYERPARDHRRARPNWVFSRHPRKALRGLLAEVGRLYPDADLS